MAKVYTPNEKYTGISATVVFVSGVGETNDADLLAWFARNGYKIEQTVADNNADKSPDNEQGNDGKQELKDKPIEYLIVYATEHNIDLGQATTHAGILKKIQEAERTE